jgi:hypothetical protein
MMERLLVESAIRSVFVAVGVAGVLWATRMKAPAVLHAMWTLVMLAMLLPSVVDGLGAESRDADVARTTGVASAPSNAVGAPDDSRAATTGREHWAAVQPGRRHCRRGWSWQGRRGPCL